MDTNCITHNVLATGFKRFQAHSSWRMVKLPIHERRVWWLRFTFLNYSHFHDSICRQNSHQKITKEETDFFCREMPTITHSRSYFMPLSLLLHWFKCTFASKRTKRLMASCAIEWSLCFTVAYDFVFTFRWNVPTTPIRGTSSKYFCHCIALSKLFSCVKYPW